MHGSFFNKSDDDKVAPSSYPIFETNKDISKGVMEN